VLAFVFDRIVAIFAFYKFNNMQKKKHSNIPIFVPELACPHRCVFCDQKKISGSLTIPDPDKISEMIETYVNTMQDGRKIEIAFFGGNFTGIPFELQKEYLSLAYKFVQNKTVAGIRISTRPDYIDNERLDLLKNFGVTTIELGAQSTNESVLLKSGRGHTVKDTENASKLILENEFELGLQMMLGLPGDSFESSYKTAIDIIKLGATSTRIYPTLVIKGTMLEQFYNAGKFIPLTVEETVQWAKEIVKLFEQHEVRILRIGLHPSKEFEDGKSLIAGPYHQSLTELVMTEIWNDILLSHLQLIEKSSATIRINPSQLNFGIGYKAKNKINFSGKGITINFIADYSLPKYKIDVSYN
jgi:histone acetyltransferase (RNA polymerase elongator complex component)